MLCIRFIQAKLDMLGKKDEKHTQEPFSPIQGEEGSILLEPMIPSIVRLSP
jgi:hypothetical protein